MSLGLGDSIRYGFSRGGAGDFPVLDFGLSFDRLHCLLGDAGWQCDCQQQRLAPVPGRCQIRDDEVQIGLLCFCRIVEIELMKLDAASLMGGSFSTQLLPRQPQHCNQSSSVGLQLPMYDKGAAAIFACLRTEQPSQGERNHQDLPRTVLDAQACS